MLEAAINRVLIGVTRWTSCAVIIVERKSMTITFRTITLRKNLGSSYANLAWMIAGVIVVAGGLPAHAQTSQLQPVVYSGVALAFHMPKPGVCTRTAKVGTRMVSDVQLLHPEMESVPPLPRGSTALLEVEDIPDTGAQPITMRVVSLTIRGRDYPLSRSRAFPDPEHVSSTRHLPSGALTGRCINAGVVLMGDLSSDTLEVQRP